MNQDFKLKLKQWGYLLGSIVLIGIFMFIIAPAMKTLPLIKPLTQYIEEQDIDAGALYYTEVEEFAIAETNMNNTMNYMPKGSNKK